MSPITVTLPWPDRMLSPNAREHWSVVSKKKRKARQFAWAMALDAKAATLVHASLSVSIVFHPPDRRARDLDNMLASMKSALDGIADACGVDDSRWAFAATAFAAPVSGGKVVVTLTPVTA
jgi:crossover junction endodeoxyribonuclease RusA